MADPQNPGGFEAMPVEDVAELLFVSAKTVRNWINKQGLPCKDDGRRRVLSWRDTLDWYVQMRIVRDGNGGNVPDPDPEAPAENLEQAETRKTIADADLKELRLAQLRGQLVPADEVGRNVGRVASAIKTKLDALPNALAMRLIGKSDRVEVQQILQDAIYRIRLELSSVGSESEPVSVSADEEDED
jgi:phage terminase Nu1 subunit (DNA packaging protein)